MKELLAACALLVGEADFVESRVPVMGEIRDRRFADVDGDGVKEIVLTVVARPADGGRSRRELHVHRIGGDGRVEPEPWRLLPVLDDAIAYGFADVRAEAGDEIVFLTRSGVWGVSAAREGYRDNIERLVEAELLYHLPDPRSLPCWRYVLRQPGGDQLLLPREHTYGLWAPTRGQPGQPRYAFVGEYDDSVQGPSFSAGDPADVRVAGGAIVFVAGGADDVFLGEQPRGALSPLYSSDIDYRAPALLDVDGDGRLDLVHRRSEALEVFLDGGTGPRPPASRVEPVPDFLLEQDESPQLIPRDLDGDGDLDVVARLERGGDGLDPSVITLCVLLNDGRLLPEQPRQLLRFEAHELLLDLVDVDGDGRLDLFLTKFEMPSMAQIASGLRVTRSTLLYLGEDEDDRLFAKKPALNVEDVFDIDTLQDAIVRRLLATDVSGDGRADLFEQDVHGRLLVRRLLLDEGFFGDSWEIEDPPWRTVEIGGTFDDFSVQDVNGDGLTDVVGGTATELVALMSRAGAR